LLHKGNTDTVVLLFFVFFYVIIITLVNNKRIASRQHINNKQDRDEDEGAAETAEVCVRYSDGDERRLRGQPVYVAIVIRRRLSPPPRPSAAVSGGAAGAPLSSCRRS